MVDVEVFRLTRLRPLNPKNSFASATPILDGDRVFVHFGGDGTAALSTAGEVLWRARFPYESQHGGGGSPVLDRDLLILNCDGNDVQAFVVAVDVKTGKERWRRDCRKPSDQAYTTPLVITVAGRDQLVSVGAYRTEADHRLTGRDIWRVSYDDGFSNVPRPVFGHGLVFIATGFQQPTLMAVRPDGQGDVTRTHVAWTLRRGAPFTPSPILVGDELYVVSDAGILSVVDAGTGRLHYQQRLGGSYSASPVFADGRIDFLSEDGAATVIAPGRDVQPAGGQPARGVDAGLDGDGGRGDLHPQPNRSIPARILDTGAAVDITAHLNWEWIAVMMLAPLPVALLVAWPIWRVGQTVLGSLAATIVTFGMAIATIGREYSELQRVTSACIDANTTCWPTPSAFTRFAIYAGIGLCQVFVVFQLGLMYESRRRSQAYAPEWRR